MDAIYVQNPAGADAPDADTLANWCLAALSDENKLAEITLRIVDTEEMRALNKQYRGKDTPTNVLSFPSELPEEIRIALLGDIVVCASVVEQEAIAQRKSATAHWAHMVVHGTLHLQGYDHMNDGDAEEMESLETKIIMGLGFPNPYNTIS